MRTDAKPLLRGFEEREADLAGSPIRYLMGGSGRPLGLVHGLGGSVANWAELAPALARRRRVIALDLPGHAGSPALPAAPTLAPFADAVAAVLEREEAVPAPLVGHSLGAVVALRTALRRPELVSGIVVASGAGISSSAVAAQRALLIIGMLRPASRIAPWRRAIGRSRLLKTLAFSYWFAADPQALSECAVDGFLVGQLAHSDFGSAWRALVREDVRADLACVRCPSLVVWGAEDRQLPVEDAFEYARRLRAPLRIIPDCGHLGIGERPDAYLDAIEWFLQEHEL